MANIITGITEIFYRFAVLLFCAFAIHSGFGHNEKVLVVNVPLLLLIFVISWLSGLSNFVQNNHTKIISYSCIFITRTILLCTIYGGIVEHFQNYYELSFIEFLFFAGIASGTIYEKISTI